VSTNHENLIYLLSNFPHTTIQEKEEEDEEEVRNNSL
jgi:hypothetical protein